MMELQSSLISNLNAILLFGGCIFCIIAAATFALAKEIAPGRRTLIANMYGLGACLLLSDLCSWTSIGREGELALTVARVSTFFLFFLPNLMFACFHGYVFHCLFGDCRDKLDQPWFPKIRFYGEYVMAALCVLWSLFSQYHTLTYSIDENNQYTRGPWFIFSFLSPVICMLFDLSVVGQYRKNATKQIVYSLLCYILLPVFAAVVQFWVYGISAVNIAVFIALVILYIAAILEQNRIAKKRREEMYQQRIDLMLSQVGPHFIYNTLTTIRHLCKTDTKLAIETIDEFAVYLRGNLDSLTVRERIPFSQELRHTQSYIAIEKKRFGERLQVEYEIMDEDFLIPAMVLQPIVENAIRHGLMPKPEGGTIRICCKKGESDYEVTVSDDGCGFDVEAFRKKDLLQPEPVMVGETQMKKRHVGMLNVRDRLSSMCGGRMKLESTIGQGTKITLYIPRKCPKEGPVEDGRMP